METPVYIMMKWDLKCTLVVFVLMTVQESVIFYNVTFAYNTFTNKGMIGYTESSVITVKTFAGVSYSP